MKRFWMISAAVIAVPALAFVSYSIPVSASNELLTKAQSEFAVKAREAVVQRGMTQAQAASVVADAAIAVPASSATEDALKPVSAPAAVAAESQNAAAASPKMAAVPETPVVPVSPAVEKAAPAVEKAAPAAQKKEASEPQLAAQPVKSELAKSEPATTASAQGTAAKTVAAPAGATSHQPEIAAQKPSRSQNAPSANSASRHFDREMARRSLPYNYQDLRTHAPGIAAAIAHYM